MTCLTILTRLSVGASASDADGRAPRPVHVAVAGTPVAAMALFALLLKLYTPPNVRKQTEVL